MQRESYVWYEKGGQIMYTLADYIGEDKVDRALQNFLMQYRYANATNRKWTQPTPTLACWWTLSWLKHRPICAI